MSPDSTIPEDTASDNKKETSPLTEEDAKDASAPSVNEQEVCAKANGAASLATGEGSAEAMEFDKLGENDVVS